MKDDELRSVISKYINKNTLNDEPFYIIELSKIKEQYDIWTFLMPDIKPYFAIKSNPDMKIIKLLAELGCNFDCASKNEIDLILNIINEPNRIIFANPCKVPSHIKYAKCNNIKLMTFDCIEELEKIKDLYNDAELVLRIAVDEAKSKCKFNSKFGCKIDDITQIFEKIQRLNMKLVGLSFHVGSNCESPLSFYNAIMDCKFAYTIATKYGIKISIIDIGGGFPGIDSNISFKDIAEFIKKAQNEFFYKEIENGLIKFIAEPGRFFTESSHTLVVNVIAKKKEKNIIKYYLNDGVYGSFNCIHYDHKLPKLISLKENFINEECKLSTFFGPTCDSMDVIYKDIYFYELNIGDWLYIKNFGSYTTSPSSSFNGFCVSKFIYYDS